MPGGDRLGTPLPPGVFDTYVRASNAHCYAIGKQLANGHMKVRKIVWGRLMARAEKRDGETIRKGAIFLARVVSKKKETKRERTARLRDQRNKRASDRNGAVGILSSE